MRGVDPSVFRRVAEKRVAAVNRGAREHDGDFNFVAAALFIPTLVNGQACIHGVLPVFLFWPRNLSLLRTMVYPSHVSWPSMTSIFQSAQD